MKKTVRLLANGFGPVDNVFNQQLCQRLFPKLSASSFRDEETESLFLSYLPRDKVFLSSDLAFYHSLFTQSHFDLSAPIALSLRHCNEDTSILPELLKDREWIGIGTDETEDLPSYSDLKMRVSWFLEPDEGPSVSVIISMRYHSCVWAILRGIPFIAIGSDPKLRSIARLFQQESFSSFFELKRNGEMIFSQLASYQKAILSNRTHLMTRTKEFSACLR